VKRRPRITSQRATRVAFVVIVAFLLAQVTWWIVFQERYISGVTRTTVAAWERDAATLNLLSAARLEPAARNRLVEAYSQLRFDGTRFEIDPEALRAFRAEQDGHLRMFAFEGPFYALVILAGLYVIAASLRAERELKRRQQNFLNAVSHEFKTPISTLRLLIETALYRPLKPEKQRDYLTRMDREVARLGAMSEQVLASARLEHAAPTPQTLTPTDLGDTVREAVERERSGLEARGARLEVHGTSDALPVSLDVSAFGIVLGNLLDNAVKYSPGPEKTVRVRLEGKRHLALVHVEDEGVGLAEAEKAHVFSPFYRVGDELTRAAPGVGLGLYLVRSITEAMNGWVRCDAPLDPQTGRGSRFSVVLPKRVTHAAPRTTPPKSPTPAQTPVAD